MGPLFLLPRINGFHWGEIGPYRVTPFIRIGLQGLPNVELIDFFWIF